MGTLIAPDRHLAIVATLFLVVAGALHLESRYAWARRVSAAVLVLLAGLALSNVRILPFSAPALTFVNEYFVVLAIPLVLLKADLRKIFAETGPTLAAYGVAVGGTVAGAVVAFLIVDLPHGAAVAGILTGGYTGGSINFVSVIQTVGVPDPAFGPATLAAGTVVAILYMIVLAWLPSLGPLQKALPLKATDSEPNGDPVEAPSAPTSTAQVRALHLVTALALSLAIVAGGGGLATALGRPGLAILLITVLSVAVANAAPRQLARLRGDAELGMILLYVFFVVFAAGADLATLADAAGWMALFATIIIVLQGAVLFAAARLFGFSYAEAITASNACILGPPTAAALAAGRGWHGLVTPGILCGVLGYAIGTFVGLSVYGWLA